MLWIPTAASVLLLVATYRGGVAIWDMTDIADTRCYPELSSTVFFPDVKMFRSQMAYVRRMRTTIRCHHYAEVTSIEEL